MKNLKLTNLSKQQLENKEMNAVKGGGDRCGCGCAYASSGGACTGDNLVANSDTGAVSSKGGDSGILYVKQGSAKGNCDSYSAAEASNIR